MTAWPTSTTTREVSTSKPSLGCQSPIRSASTSFSHTWVFHSWWPVRAWAGATQSMVSSISQLESKLINLLWSIHCGWQNSISGYITWVNDGKEAWTMRAPGKPFFVLPLEPTLMTPSYGSQCSSYDWPKIDLGRTNVHPYQLGYIRKLWCSWVSGFQSNEQNEIDKPVMMGWKHYGQSSMSLSLCASSLILIR